VTTSTATWVADLSAALGDDGVLTDPDPQGLLNPGKVLRRAHAADLAGAAGLAGQV
jgi:hypothetical protein